MTYDSAKKSIESVIESLAQSFIEERHKQEPYKEMFKAGSSYTGLLNNLENTIVVAVLDAHDVYKERLGLDISSKGLHEAYEFMLMLPYLSYKIEKLIETSEGSACCTDKTFFLLSEKLREITERNKV